jgi:hypothetical protein
VKPAAKPAVASTPAAAPAAAKETVREAKPAATAPAQPPVVSGSKEDKLKQLLEAYRTGTISAADYHRERSKVLGQ